MEKEKMMECAMQIIAYAGSAFDYFNRAIETAEEGQLEEARQYLAEARGEDLPFSILMVHAQDHLTMAIFSERMAGHFLKLWEKKGR